MSRGLSTTTLGGECFAFDIDIESKSKIVIICIGSHIGLLAEPCGSSVI